MNFTLASSMFLLYSGFYKCVNIMLQFRFATKGDAALMITGMLCAIIHGCAMQLLIIIFGDMIDSFVINEKDIPVNFTALGMTQEYAKDHPNEFG